MSALKRILQITAIQSRQTSTNAAIKPLLTNRNPRNLEKLRIAYKPDGYHLEKPGKCYWHKLEVETSTRYVKATVHHFENGGVVSASTQEWPIKKQLYRYNDTSAYINLGRVLAHRCLQYGITEIRCDKPPQQAPITSENEQGKLAQFYNALEQGGVVLEEAQQYKKPRPWDQHRPEKPWEVTD